MLIKYEVENEMWSKNVARIDHCFQIFISLYITSYFTVFCFIFHCFLLHISLREFQRNWQQLERFLADRTHQASRLLASVGINFLNFEFQPNNFWYLGKFHSVVENMGTSSAKAVTVDKPELFEVDFIVKS